MHQKGVEAEQYIRTAQETLAKILKVKEKEIFFTSGGTESDNWALVGTAMANKRTGNHIITSAIEHPAVSAPLAFLEEQGFRITRLPVNKEGLVDVNPLLHPRPLLYQDVPQNKSCRHRSDLLLRLLLNFSMLLKDCHPQNHLPA